MADFFGEHTSDTGSVEEQEYLIEERNPLTVDLDDDEFVKVMDDLIGKSEKYFRKKGLFENREKNLEYYHGKTIEKLESEGKLSPTDARFSDPVIYEAEQTLRAVALSRVPDMIVQPVDQEEESKKLAEKISDVINTALNKDDTRRVLELAYRHRPLYYVGVIKYYWDEEKGDYCFEAINPDDVTIDHTVNSANPEEMQYVVHNYDISVKECVMRWPDKERELLSTLGFDQHEQPTEKYLASKIKISEIWFTWYDKVGKEWQTIEGVAWKYKDLVFEKMKNPYWDWEGVQILYTYDKYGKKRELEENELRTGLESGQLPGLEMEKIYYNYFKHPRKPFIFLTYDCLGLLPIDETTRIEQSRYLQDNVNTRGAQITTIASNARPKLVFSEKSGLTKADLQAMDMKDPDEKILVNGKLNEVFTFIPGEQPSAALFEEKGRNADRIFSIMGTNSAIRGAREAGDTATRTQILKESDFTKIDSEVENTVNPAAKKMAEAAMQMIRLFYTEEKMISILGEDGNWVFVKVNRDFVQDGMEVRVSASSVDKRKRKAEAFELAKLKQIDPLTFFEDIEASDPEGRTERLMTFMTSPELYMQKYISKNETAQQMATALNGRGQSQVMMDIAQLQQGQTPQPPAQMTPQYIQAISAFLKSPEFSSLPEEVQRNTASYARSLQGMART